jgi:HSP20 family molecular chaperone IbpA
MSRKDPVNWMLSEAIDSLARAERLRQQFFSLQPTANPRESSWEPPIDVLETEREVLILVALPGVDPDQVEAVIEDGMLIISGRRVLPVELRNARIHRLELPQGRFERRIMLPTGRYVVSRFAVNGCVGLRLSKSA